MLESGDVKSDAAVKDRSGFGKIAHAATDRSGQTTCAAMQRIWPKSSIKLQITEPIWRLYLTFVDDLEQANCIGDRNNRLVTLNHLHLFQSCIRLAWFVEPFLLTRWALRAKSADRLVDF